ncbi:MAG TPA: methyltransferase domain-containing protein [Ignavibacteria bacterium]|nr:methyltransferase domain-containing protein [Ignavibacteria bacterium]
MKVLDRKLDRTKTKKNYKNVVWFYDFWSWLTESEAAKYVIEFADIKENETILEVACGTGTVFEQIVKRNPIGKNIGIDLSPDMLEKAKKKLKNIKRTNYELKEGDALHLDFENNYFDSVINNFMVDLMPSDTFDNIAEEFYRVTKPNGKVIVSTFSFGKKKINKFWLWVAKKFPDLLTGCRPVSFKENLIKTGFEIEKDIEISQNTFPSEIIKARKVDRK